MALHTIKLPRETMLEILDDKDLVVYDALIRRRRWSTAHRLVFRHEGKLWHAYYSRAATELQDETPWQHEPEVECTEVEAFERIVVDYRPRVT